MRVGETLGRLWFYRGKGTLYLEAVRQWILPIMGASALSKYLGFSFKYSVLLWIGIALCAETAVVFLGWFERRSGATASNYGLARDTDPFKRESLRLAAETAKEARAIRVLAAELCRRLPPPR